MYVVIVGASGIGDSLAETLVTAQHEVAIVDRDASRCAALDERLGNISVVGDGTEEGTLAKAGANRADVLIAATGRDDQNLVACQLARHRFGTARTISLVSIPEHEALFNLLGIDVVINTTDLIVGSIQERLNELSVEELVDMA